MCGSKDQNRGGKLEDSDKLVSTGGVCEDTEVGLAMEAAPAVAMDDPLVGA